MAMEGLTQLGQEEYIWAMRTEVHLQASEVAHHRSFERARPSRMVEDTILDEKQTRVMASLVPDEVISNVNDYDHRDFDACLLFGDVSGFTDLCEKYSKTGVSGPSKMTQVLNKYLGSMVQEILSHGGDVFKFSGDAFLAIFKATETEPMRDAVHEAIDCALVIQKNYGSYVTDVGIVIRVKLAISAGLVTFGLIGDAAMSHYVIVGKPIWDVKSAEHLSHAGDIIIVQPAWIYVGANEYLFQELPDNYHIKILGVGPNWRIVQRNVKKLQTQDGEESILSQDSDTSDFDTFSEITLEGVEDFCIRPAVNFAVARRIKDSLKKFIIGPVMKSIDKDEPFEYLSEMRQTVIVFINVVTNDLPNNKIIRLTDRSYKIVCRVVNKMKGCVNKVSLFDKGLMFVVIFGLRGHKHELECQAALGCAKECHTAISKLSDITSVSVGVTTGKTYCGVFGHTLRREYTVISLVVNKAARLMVAYEGIVTCDRETFLHSKLESTHFLLQEFKPLKGISHPGPVYEFRKVEADQDVVQKINACPLLGRLKNIELYDQLVNKYLEGPDAENPECKMLLFNGEARQGKTRLLDELVYRTPEQLPITRFSLTKEHYKIPYQTMKLIFYPVLGLTKESSITQREQSLLKVLNDIKVPDLLCVLNEVFSVNFEKSASYLSFNDVNKKKALKKIMKLLVKTCFQKLWILAIDDCDFIDRNSLEIFDLFFEVDTILIVATISRISKTGKTEVSKVFADSRVKMVYLKSVNKRYLAALACQILDVYGISPELEYAIQTKSNGNPGWIESFLISLIQDNALNIFEADLNEIHELGLVCPPYYMMVRLSEEETKKWQQVMEERHDSSTSVTTENHWTKYIDTCRDSYLNITIREEIESIPADKKVPICVITPNFESGADQMELSIDVVILKTFDSLSFFEQLLVKCSATLGNEFFRQMLLYVMATTNLRQVALAVQKLFEIRVLACAKGDFLENGSTVFREKLLNPHEETVVACHCKGIKVDMTCFDLPKYASCGYMQFRSSSFRDITYNLLTENQKKEFHERATVYLERETRKCRSCGNGVFEHILGPKHDQNLLLIKSEKRRGGFEWNQDASFRTSISSYTSSLRSYSSYMSQDSQSQRSTMTFIRGKSMASQERVRRSASQSNIVIPSSPIKAKLGYSLIKKLKNSHSLTRSFSSEDFTDCQCYLILSTAYAQLIEHTTGAGVLSKTLDAMLEYAHLCIVTSNIALAKNILERALNVLKQRSYQKIENMWKLTLIRAKIYILIGHTKLELGYLDQAFENLHKALAQYEIAFPKGISKTLKSWKHGLRQLFCIYIYPKSFWKKLDHWGTIYSNNLSECLAHLCTLYMLTNQWDSAYLAAIWSLNRALASFSDFQIITTACSNMLEVALHFRQTNLSIAFEVHFLRLCHFKKDSLKAEDVKCICKLYSIIFMARLYRSELEKAVDIGHIVLRLGVSIRAAKIVLPVIPLMAHCLLAQKHYVRFYSVLEQLSYFADQDTDRSARVWYYVLCLQTQIETGYTILSYGACEQFYQFEGNVWATIRDPDARKRFYALMWLWCIRNEYYEAASIWHSKSETFLVVSKKDSFTNKITALYILEGLIVYLVSKMDKHNVNAISRTDTEIRCLIKALERVVKETKFLMPRFYHLKAYYRFVVENDSQVFDLLDKARSYAEHHGNYFEIDWIEHSTKAWKKNLTPESIDFWKDHSETDNGIDFQEIDNEDSQPGFYTLPTPRYM